MYILLTGKNKMNMHIQMHMNM